MKKLLVLILLGSFAFLHACVGPVGPPGPPGPQGRDGLVLLGEAFEVDINFTEANGYADIFTLNPPIEPSDVLLVYVRWEVDNGTPIWRHLPQSVFFDEGILVYNFDFTEGDFEIFMETTFDPALLDNSWTRNQRFRIVIIPAEFGSARIDYNDYDGVMSLLGLSESDIVKLKSKNEN